MSTVDLQDESIDGELLARLLRNLQPGLVPPVPTRRILAWLEYFAGRLSLAGELARRRGVSDLQPQALTIVYARPTVRDVISESTVREIVREGAATSRESVREGPATSRESAGIALVSVDVGPRPALPEVVRQGVSIAEARVEPGRRPELTTTAIAEHRVREDILAVVLTPAGSTGTPERGNDSLEPSIVAEVVPTEAVPGGSKADLAVVTAVDPRGELPAAPAPSAQREARKAREGDSRGEVQVIRHEGPVAEPPNTVRSAVIVVARPISTQADVAAGEMPSVRVHQGAPGQGTVARAHHKAQVTPSVPARDAQGATILVTVSARGVAPIPVNAPPVVVTPKPALAAGVVALPLVQTSATREARAQDAATSAPPPAAARPAKPEILPATVQVTPPAAKPQRVEELIDLEGLVERVQRRLLQRITAERQRQGGF